MHSPRQALCTLTLTAEFSTCAGYSYLYAAALVPMGLLADRLPRPKLLGLGVAAWSGLALAASHANSFAEMMIIRVGFAAAQSAQVG